MLYWLGSTINRCIILPVMNVYPLMVEVNFLRIRVTATFNFRLVSFQESNIPIIHLVLSLTFWFSLTFRFEVALFSILEAFKISFVNRFAVWSSVRRFPISSIILRWFPILSRGIFCFFYFRFKLQNLSFKLLHFGCIRV